jgi:hypothetical protein
MATQFSGEGSKSRSEETNRFSVSADPVAVIDATEADRRRKRRAIDKLLDRIEELLLVDQSVTPGPLNSRITDVAETLSARDGPVLGQQRPGRVSVVVEPFTERTKP